MADRRFRGNGQGENAGEAVAGQVIASKLGYFQAFGLSKNDGGALVPQVKAGRA